MKKIIEEISQLFDGEKARLHTKEISSFYRSPGSTGYNNAFDYVHNQMNDIPFDKISVDTFPLTERSGYAPAWEPIKTEVNLIYPHHEKIISFDEVPTCLTWYSSSTGKGGVTAELCDVGSGLSEQDYHGLNLEGKIVLASGNKPEDTLRVYDLAVKKFGALGFLSDCLISPIDGLRTKELKPDYVSLNRLSRKYNDGWAVIISGRMGKKLRNLLADSKVMVNVDIEAKTFNGTGKSLICEITGKTEPENEILLVSHLTNPQPNANCASGPALMVELAKVFYDLIQKNKIDAFERTVKFLFVPEGLGSKAYIAKYSDSLSNIISMICLCGTGQDQDLSKSFLSLSRTPDSIPSFINDLSYSFLEKSVNTINPQLKFRETPYSPFSDNSYFNSASVPSVLLSSEPNIFFHTQYLTWETTSSEVFNVSACVVGGTIQYLSDVEVSSVVRLINIISARSRLRVTSKASELTNAESFKSKSSTEKLFLLNNRIDYLINRDLLALESCNKLSKSLEIKALVEDSKKQLTSFATDYTNQILNNQIEMNNCE